MTAMASLVGDSLQAPPAYSAVKVGGRKLYEAARKRRGAGGRAPSDPRGRVRVDRVSRPGRRLPWSRAREARTSGCCWPTSASMLGCGAHLTRLRRTAIGALDVADAVAPEDVVPLPMDRAVAHLPRLDLGEDEAIAAGHGRILGPAGIAGPYAVFAPDRNADRCLRGRRLEGSPAGHPRRAGLRCLPGTSGGLGSGSHGRRGATLEEQRVAIRLVRRLAPDRGGDLRLRHPEVRGLRRGVEGDHHPHAHRDGIAHRGHDLQPLHVLVGEHGRVARPAPLAMRRSSPRRRRRSPTRCPAAGPSRSG